MLFVIVMKAFNRLVGHASLVELLFGFSAYCLGRGLLAFFHILFADDTRILQGGSGLCFSLAVHY